jgi:hypothetical protein
MIEVWERLDCESVGAAEIEIIEKIVGRTFGAGAVDSPMTVARLLADEGAELRHSEIMDLYISRNAETIYDAELRNLVNIEDLEKAASSLQRMENLRRKYESAADDIGLRLLREKAIKFKETANERSLKTSLDERGRLMNAEIAEWITHWVRTPHMFESWLTLRLRSDEFREWFGGGESDA